MSQLVSSWRGDDQGQRLSDPSEVRSPEPVSFAAAQTAVNFVVFEPRWVPEDCHLESTTLRPEQPPGRPDDISADAMGQTPWTEGNPCSLRTIIDGDGRRIRLKQFLYDWAPPAASIAPLWRTPDPTPVEIGDVVGWLGTDYKENRGACCQRERTQIELSVLEGTVTDDELTGLLDGLVVANPSDARRVRRTPFHLLNYWVRYQIDGPGVPHGLFSYEPSVPYSTSTVLAPSGFSTEQLAIPRPEFREYAFDSAVAFPEADAAEWILRHEENASDHLWLLSAAETSSLAPSFPPEASDQPATTRERRSIGGQSVHYGCLHPTVGALEARWKNDDQRYALLASASRELDEARFFDIVEGLV